MLRRIALMLTMALNVALSPSSSLASSQGVCSFNGWPPDQTGQWRFDNYAGTGVYFDDIHGWLTDRALFPCEGLGIGYGWSYAAAANVEDNTLGGIWQLGIAQVAGQGGDQNYFVRTESNGSGNLVLLPSGIRPSFGTRYHFRVYKGSSDGFIHYAILNVAGTVLWSYNTNHAWPSTLKHAWWGYETGNSQSMPGIDDGDPHADLVGQFSYNNSGTISTQTNIYPATTCPNNPCSYWWPSTSELVTGPNNEIFNVTSP